MVLINKSEGVVAVVLAAGTGLRMNGTDKMLACLDGRPLLEWSLNVLDSSEEIDAIQLVVPDHEESSLVGIGRTAVRRSEFRVCSGGPSRAVSTLYGLRAASNGDFVWAIVHDGARPFITNDMVVSSLEAAAITGAAITAMPATDTVQISDEDGFIVESPQRRIVWMAQTPQVARLSPLLAAHEQLLDRLGEFTDEASVLREIGHRVAISQGSYSNVKITTAEDLEMAKFTIDRLHSRRKV